MEKAQCGIDHGRSSFARALASALGSAAAARPGNDPLAPPPHPDASGAEKKTLYKPTSEEIEFVSELQACVAEGKLRGIAAAQIECVQLQRVEGGKVQLLKPEREIVLALAKKHGVTLRF